VKTSAARPGALPPPVSGGGAYQVSRRRPSDTPPRLVGVAGGVYQVQPHTVTFGGCDKTYGLEATAIHRGSRRGSLCI